MGFPHFLLQDPLCFPLTGLFELDEECGYPCLGCKLIRRCRITSGRCHLSNSPGTGGKIKTPSCNIHQDMSKQDLHVIRFNHEPLNLFSNLGRAITVLDGCLEHSFAYEVQYGAFRRFLKNRALDDVIHEDAIRDKKWLFNVFLSVGGDMAKVADICVQRRIEVQQRGSGKLGGLKDRSVITWASHLSRAPMHRGGLHVH